MSFSPRFPPEHILVPVDVDPLADRALAERLIDDAKPLSRHLIGLAISLEARGICPVHVAAYEGDEMVIYPYTPEVVEVAGMVCIQGADHTRKNAPAECSTGAFS